jgi:hypothetical protein
MSEQDELDRLERQLDAAFASTRPRRGFEDELWERLHARRRRWWTLSWLTPAQSLAGGLAVVALFGLLIGTVALFNRHENSGSGTPSTAAEKSVATSGSADTGRQLAPQAPGAQASAPQPFGTLPAPAGAFVVQVPAGGRLSPLPAGVRTTILDGSLPQPAPTLSVFRYDPASGPPDGAILEPGSLPPNLTGSPYPTRPASGALQDASGRGAAGATPTGEATMTQARIVYVAVVSGASGYLEPAYLFTGTYQNGSEALPVQVLVPAVAAAALR